MNLHEIFKAILDCLENKKIIHIIYEENLSVKGIIRSFSFDGNDLTLNFQEKSSVCLKISSISSICASLCCLTYEEYDQKVECMKQKVNFRPSIPSIYDIADYIEKSPRRYLNYLIFLSETITPATEEEKLCMKRIKQILYENLELEEN